MTITRITIKFIAALTISVVLYSTMVFRAQAQQIAQGSLPAAELINFRTGKIVNTTDLTGKVVYLDFWASWCIPCKKSFPFMNEIYHQYPKEHLAVIAINMDESPEDAVKFLEAVPAHFDIFTNPDKSLVTELDLPGLPVAYLIDKNGQIKARHIGFNERKKAKKLKQLKYLLGQDFSVEPQ